MKSPNCEIVCTITAALQISISCRRISSFEQPTFIPRRQLKLTSVFHVQDKGGGAWKARGRALAAGGGVGFFTCSDDVAMNSSEEPTDIF